MSWISRLEAFSGTDEIVARAVIVAVSGPTPRAVGAAMLIGTDRNEGRIGRPEVMAAVLSAARALIPQRRSDKGTPWLRERATFATGAVLGESTGGELTVLIEVFDRRERTVLTQLAAGAAAISRPMISGPPPQPIATAPGGISAPLLITRDREPLLHERITPMLTPFHVYGTGLVAQALVRLLIALPFVVTWYDSVPPHFPKRMPESVELKAAPDLAAIAASASPGCFHAVMTQDHALDLAICSAVLRAENFGYLGVIGSKVKRERLLARLAVEGHEKPALARLACPMGLPDIASKSPPVIALSIAAQVMIELQRAKDRQSGENA